MIKNPCDKERRIIGSKQSESSITNKGCCLLLLSNEHNKIVLQYGCFQSSTEIFGKDKGMKPENFP